MKLATTTADLAKYAADTAGAVRLFAGTGFRYLDYSFDVLYPGSAFLGPDWPRQVNAAAEAAAETGMTFVQAHAPSHNSLDPNADHETGLLATARTIEACGRLGIPNIVVHSGGAGCYRYPQDRLAYYEAILPFYRQLFPYMEKYNVKVLIENGCKANQGAIYSFRTAEDMRGFLDYAGHPLLGICWDTGHANLEENMDQYRELKALGSALTALHVQDNDGIKDEHIAPFNGTLDLDAIIQGLLAIDFQGYFTLEACNFLRTENCWPNFRKSTPLPAPTRLRRPSAELARQSVALLYQIGKYALEQYGCFEE